MKTQVAIIGAGPAGLLLAEMLHHHGIDSVVLEKKSRNHVLSRIRSGVLEQVTLELLKTYGLSHRIEKEGQPHAGFKVVWGEDQELFVDLTTTKQSLIIYGQSQLQQDLFHAADIRKAGLFTEITGVQLIDSNTSVPKVIFNLSGDEVMLHCDFIIGCDGFHGISRQMMRQSLAMHEISYPFSWLGVLSATAPLTHITYANHAQGFALASARNAQLSRYYIQVPADERVQDWSDDRFWFTLKARFPVAIAEAIMTGPSLEKSIIPLRSSLMKKVNQGRLFLAGDAAHILPPTGAKGLNLAVADVFYLTQALAHYYQQQSTWLLDHYNEATLQRVEHAMRIASHMTHLLHRFPGETEVNQMVREHALHNLQSSRHLQNVLAKQYNSLDVRAQIQQLQSVE